jgi:hypothetical protein
MINLNECLSEYNLEIDKVTYWKNYIIIDSDSDKYLFKIRDSNKRELYNYLESINYSYYLELINNYDDYFELYRYYEDKVYDNYTKAKEMIYALSSLHLKSVKYKNYNIDEVKKIYEDKIVEIDNMMKYYLDLQDYIEEMSFPTAGYYLLIKNISKIYELLRRSRNYLDRWYSDGDNKFSLSLLIENLSLDNFRMGDKTYFIDLGNFTWDFSSFDLDKFYKSNFNLVEMKSLINIYNLECHTDYRSNLFFKCLIAIPWKLNFSKNNYSDSIMVRKLIDYVDYTLEFLEEDKEDKETEKEDFKE